MFRFLNIPEHFIDAHSKTVQIGWSVDQPSRKRNIEIWYKVMYVYQK